MYNRSEGGHVTSRAGRLIPGYLNRLGLIGKATPTLPNISSTRVCAFQCMFHAYALCLAR